MCFLGFGEVASRLAPALQQNGATLAAYDIVIERADGAAALKSRAGATPIEFMPLADAIARSEFVLSTVTTDVALDAARACAPHLTDSHTFVDLNATSPAIKRSIGAAVKPTGAHFIEGAILGAIGVTGAQTRILVCGGNAAGVAQRLRRLGLNVEFCGTDIGRASTFKMLRSVFSKGMEALLLEAMLAAHRAGVADDIWREIVETLDERPFADVGGNWMRTHGTAHARRYHEMVQVEALLTELEVDPLVTRATTAFFERSTRLELSQALQRPLKSHEEVVAALERLLGGASSGSQSKKDT